jgi:hypothetical protein
MAAIWTSALPAGLPAAQRSAAIAANSRAAAESNGPVLTRNPDLDGRRRIGPHGLGYDVGVEDDQSNRGGSRRGSRGYSGSSTPPNGAKRRLMAVARSTYSAGTSGKAERRMQRASSSMDRPFRAARTRKRCFSASARFRMVRLAIRSM